MKAGIPIAIVAAVASLAWLYVAMKPADAPAPAPAAPTATPSAAPSAAPESASFGSPAAAFTFAIGGGRVTAAPEALRVKRGAAVMIRVSSDKADTLHLHGYDLELQLHSGQPGVLLFTADKPGRFDLELHHAGIELGALEVEP